MALLLMSFNSYTYLMLVLCTTNAQLKVSDILYVVITVSIKYILVKR